MTIFGVILALCWMD